MSCSLFTEKDGGTKIKQKVHYYEFMTIDVLRTEISLYFTIAKLIV